MTTLTEAEAEADLAGEPRPDHRLAAICEEVDEVVDAWKRTLAFLVGTAPVDLSDSFPIPRYMLPLNAAIARLDAIRHEVTTGKVADAPNPK